MVTKLQKIEVKQLSHILLEYGALNLFNLMAHAWVWDKATINRFCIIGL